MQTTSHQSRVSEERHPDSPCVCGGDLIYAFCCGAHIDFKKEAKKEASIRDLQRLKAKFDARRS